MSGFHKQHIAGFTLVEVLVSVVILAIGLLGLAGMQTLSLKNNQDAFLYTQATALAYEMGDRIKVNPVPWQSSSLPTPASTCPNTSCNSKTNLCTPAQMASFDYCGWKAKAFSLLGSSNTTAIIEWQRNTGSCPGNTGTVCIQMSWVTGNQTSSSSNNKGSFQLEVRP